MKPIDPRLLRYARATRGFLLASVALGLAGASLVIAQAMLIAEVVVRAFQDGDGAADLRVPLLLLGGVALGRALVSWLTELAAHRAGAAVKSELRLRLLRRATVLGPDWLGGQRTGELTALATRGVDALDDYFARYLPQLGLAVVVPAAVLARIVWSDWIAALTIALTLPLIPLFMILIGWATQSRMDRQWRLLTRLSGHFLDVVAGLPTLKVFGRAKAQAENIRAITADYRRATLRTLRLAFLSSFALELLATISVALVAVGIGMRLVHGDLDLYTGLVVLVLAPEAYLPLRQVGAQYHAAAEGLAAAEQVFDVLETPLSATGTRPAPDAGRASLILDQVLVRHEGRAHDSLPETSLSVAPGETVALVGPSGAGKTTLLNTVLGFTRPTAGRVLLSSPGPGATEAGATEADSAEVELGEVDLSGWHPQIAWVSQHPHLFAGTLAENVRLARPTATDAEVRAALRQASAADLDPAAVLGEHGAGLSAGQRQRVALARAFLADRPLLLLDEPTAALDGGTEAEIVEAIRSLAAGRTVLLVVHRPALLALADRVVTLPAPDAPPYSALTGAKGTGNMPTHGAPDAESPASSANPAPDQGPPGSSGDTAAARGPLAWLRSVARPLTGRFTLALLLGALAVGSGVGLMSTSGWLISRASEQPPVLYLMVAVTATRAFGIGRAVFRYAERLVSHDAVLRVLADLRVTVYRRLERLAPAGLRRARRGDLLTRLVSDVDALQDYFLRWLLPAATALTVSLAAVAFTAALLPAAGAVLALGLATAGIGVPALSAALSRRTERRLAPARSELATRTVDLLTGTGELTVAGVLAARTAEVRAADTALTGIAARSASRTALGSGLTALVTGLTVSAAGWVGAQAVADGRLAGVWLAVVVLTPLAAFEAVAGLPLAVQYRQRSRRSAERVREVLGTPEPCGTSRGGTEALPAPDPARPPRLALHGVSARYPGSGTLALRGFDLELAPGRRVAVVGVSGSGKSTLAQVLLRFLDPESGTYTLSGGVDATAADATAADATAADATAADADAVRRLVGLCAQDAHHFDSSLRENLRLARPGATDADLLDVLRAARLDAWVRSLPAGLDTLVGEHGARLSGGQRQRLALARTLLADFPVLVLDEPAEHLDLPTADALTDDLLAVTEGRTTVLITHRLYGLAAVDEVIVLDGGRAVERGTYAALAATEDGPFRRMLDREAETDALLAGSTGAPGRGGPGFPPFPVLTSA
ncbi:thiol reductant ABC exporter subunit CydD [Streptomyces sp. N2-109]|uniref:Thiol reductant ABC exporter subunit CydD n=1 Tax=Streptomyces gossypii TaxID=2883101 RepID=A0ABT2JN41_9ACTN|nr:thiol reductant ABC exporter subunit CydD [Streptomyces gossypii]MCT2589296.1 thiol reductant ABC exporter subunit CydD [Streptomyces gossypii]